MCSSSHRALRVPVLVALIAAGCLTAPRARAQQQDGANAALAQGAMAPTGAVEPTATVAPTSAKSAQAREVVARAKALFAIGNYRAALAEFSRAYDLLAGDPRSGALLNNIAVCYERLFRYDLALQYYARYLQQDIPPEDRAEVRAVMRSLRDVLGMLRVNSTRGAEVWIDDHRLGQAPVELLVPAGTHVIELRRAGYESVRRELRVDARSVKECHILLAPLPRGLHPAYFWAGSVLTAGALVTGSALGVAALSEHARLHERADRGYTIDRAHVRELALEADIAFATALALGVGTTVLFFSTDWHGGASGGEHRHAPSPQLAAASFASDHGFGLTLAGAFP